MEEFLIEPVSGKRAISYPELLELLVLNDPEELDADIVIEATYMTEKAVGADVFAEIELTVPPHGVAYVPTGLKAKFPGDFGLFAYLRSSIPGKTGLMMANSVGVIEADYYANPENDGNIHMILYNSRDTAFTIRRFERLGQLAILPVARFANAGRMAMTRGASGSTG